MKDHDTLDIANRIMRKDNYLIGLVNQHVFPTTLNIFGSNMFKVSFFGKAFEWNLRIALLNPMFSSDLTIEDSFLFDHTALKKRFLRFGVINLALMPFILLFLAIFFFLKHFESFYSNRSDLLAGERARTWSPVARWKFREFNELPHLFSDRIESSELHSLSQTFIKQFPNYTLAIVARLVSYISGSIVGVLLATLALGQASVLSNLHVFGKSFLWFLILCSSILAVSRQVSEANPPTREPEEVMKEIYSRTHYFPDAWTNNCHQHFVYKEFLSLYQLKLEIFLQEMLSVVLTPFVFTFVLPNLAANIAEFIQMHSKSISGLGDVCDFSRFDVKNLGDRKYNVIPTSNVNDDKHHSRQSVSLQHAKDGKLEKSVLNFASAYPNWSVNPDCGVLLRSLYVSESKVDVSTEKENLPMMDSEHLLSQSFSKLMPQKMVSSQTNMINSMIRSNFFLALLEQHHAKLDNQSPKNMSSSP